MAEVQTVVAIALVVPAVGARLAVKLGVAQGWERYIGAHGEMLGVARFGASAPTAVMLREYGFSVDNVCARATALLARVAADQRGQMPCK
jgi:transketolase